jgi:hypothetical protein
MLVKRIILACCAFLLLGAFILALPENASAAKDLFEVCQKGGGNSAACSTGEEGISGNNGIVLKAANLVAIIAGITAVIMIMVGAFQYLTSAGDTGKVTSGKNIIIYALVGLVVIVIARTIVGFVIDKVL